MSTEARESLFTNETSADGEFVVLVSLSNPETEAHLISLGAALANQRDGRVVAVNIIPVPDQTPLEAAREQFDLHEAESLLEGARRDASALGAPIETHTIFSHQSFAQIFDTARRLNANICVMGWGPDSPGVAGRAEPVVDELVHSLPCDFLVFRDRGFDPSRILLPTTGGPHTDMAAIVAQILHEEFDSEVTLLHVSDSKKEGEEFLQTWAMNHGLTNANRRVETGDVEVVITNAAQEHTLILIGATQEGILSRLVRGSLILNVLDDVTCSVLITERKTERGLLHKLFSPE